MEQSHILGEKVNLNNFYWINKPVNFKINSTDLTIFPESKTDLWQRTYYGFQNDNAPALLTELESDFTFVVKTAFSAKNQFDQCGVLLYQNSENWVKASIEYENETIARLGSVVTNMGFSDWATKDISANISEMWYRFSRRGQDFYIEYSTDGETFKQMRVLHMHLAITVVQIGVYACSPVKSGFKAIFSEFRIGSCQWQLHT
ncbi:MAG: DUF1349 domain-containing protein [Draconibacterium sp.]|nr:DUF1349 domain-containing protein [Draconibacterium sp.]